ncbi:MAG TPA: metallopeptidase TldD-related protein [Gemmatimonadaceae bacterium]
MSTTPRDVSSHRWSARDGGDRILSRAECAAIADRIARFARGGGDTEVRVQSWWGGELRWARNRVSLASDRRDIVVQVVRTIRGAKGIAQTNQIDDASLEAAVRVAEREARITPTTPRDFEMPRPAFDYAKTMIWSDATYDRTAPERGAAARALIDPAEAAGMLSAGYLGVRAEATSHFPVANPPTYAASTRAECSMTVRDARGAGSGWAGASSYDIAAIDAPALAARALEKCLASRNPVALEPGRYTVILEPQAVHDLVSLITQRTALFRPFAEQGLGSFVAGYDDALKTWRSKLGSSVVDERITISHDPADPLLGVVPFDENDEPYRPVTWIDHGVLETMYDHRPYALQTRNDPLGHPNSGSYRMSGGETSVDEMIASTKRGLIVTRFSDVMLLDESSLLATGLTRDGLWLVENGHITKAVKNLRFTESPLFVLNGIEQLGAPVPVFSPEAPAIVPPLKARDFSFTSVIDAI